MDSITASILAVFALVWCVIITRDVIASRRERARHEAWKESFRVDFLSPSTAPLQQVLNCHVCGKPTMHIGNVCYSCSNLPHAPTAEATAQDATEAAGRSHSNPAPRCVCGDDPFAACSACCVEKRAKGLVEVDVLGDLQATSVVMPTGPRLTNKPPVLPTINHRAGEFPPIITPAQIGGATATTKCGGTAALQL